MSWTITAQQKVNWTPASLSPVLWLDAADSSSFTFSSGTAVSEWRSRSGSYALTQSDTAKQPSRSGTVNGQSTVIFDGGDGMSVASFDLSSAGQRLSIFSVLTASSGTTQIILEHGTNYNNLSGGFILSRQSADNLSYAFTNSFGNYSTFDTTGTLTTSPKVYVGYRDGTLSVNETSAWLDGTLAGTRPLDANLSNSYANGTLYLGSRANTSLYLNGQICELGLVTGVLSDDNRLRIEGYLAWKWGTTANLPSNHLYKTNAPAP